MQTVVTPTDVVRMDRLVLRKLFVYYLPLSHSVMCSEYRDIPELRYTAPTHICIHICMDKRCEIVTLSADLPGVYARELKNPMQGDGKNLPWTQ